MRPTIRLTAMPEETHFAPLGVFGYCLTRTHFLEPVLKSVRLPLKTVAHSPASKLLDVLVSILAGCRAIRQVNTLLRPDLALAHAWGRERFAEQAIVFLPTPFLLPTILLPSSSSVFPPAWVMSLQPLGEYHVY